jgi:mono/diheme cytochrome c family protein
VVHPGPTNQTPEDVVGAAALAASKQDPAAVARGGKLFRANCAGCHGANAKGGPGAPDLVRSVLVLDDEKGILIGPVVREGRPDKGMPKFNMTDAQIQDIAAWLHVLTYAAGHRTTYEFKNVVNGNAEKGKAYFNGQGRCATCHSVTGDLAGIGAKYDAFSLQGRWLQPRGGRRGARGGVTADRTITVTLASGETYKGTLSYIDDFTVALRDGKGQYHSFARKGAVPKVEINDPLQAHMDLLHHYTDDDIHNITAYLVTLK